MQKCVILVDNSNIFIAGKHYSAKLQGIGPKGHGREWEGSDPLWRIDFDKLIAVLAKGRPVKDAILVGSRPPFADAVWKAAEETGFEVIVHDRNFDGKEKAIDTELVARGTEIVVLEEKPGVLILASGDLDLLPLVNVAKEHGWRVEMCAFKSTFRTDSELCRAVDEVRVLDDVFDEIGHREEEEEAA